MKLKDKVKTALDEARMLVLGCQVLIGFQFQAVYQDGFSRLDFWPRLTHTLGLGLMIVALGFLMAPGAFHILAEGQRPTRKISDVVTDFTGVALLPLAVGLGMNIMVVTSSVLGVFAGAAVGILFAFLALALWWLWALAARRHHGREEREMAATRIDEDGELSDRIDHLLAEARTILPGAQALMGFQLIVVFTRRFEQMPAAAQRLHLVALGLVALSIILLMAPAAYHRLVYAGESSAGFLAIGNRLVISATVPLGLGLAIDLGISTERTLGSVSLALAAGLLALSLLSPASGTSFRSWPAASGRHDSLGSRPRDQPGRRVGSFGVLLPGCLAPFEKFPRLPRGGPGEGDDGLSLQFAVADEKRFDLVEHGRRQIGNVLSLAMRMAVDRHREKAIVSNDIAVFDLFGFDRADEPGVHDASHGNVLVEEQQYVEGIAVFAECRGYEAEIEGEDQTEWQHVGETIAAELMVELVFVATAARCFDNDVDGVVLLVVRRQAFWNGKPFHDMVHPLAVRCRNSAAGAGVASGPVEWEPGARPSTPSVDRRSEERP